MLHGVKRRPLARSSGKVLLFAVATGFSTACGDACVDHTATYQLGGDVTATGLTCGSVVIDFAEDTSTHCAGHGTVSSQVPGRQVAQTTISGLGAWSASVPVSYAGDTEPKVDVIAFCDGDGNAAPGPGEACGMVTVVPGAGGPVHVSLDHESCPGRD
jgi:hypothetical protein